MTYRRRSKNHRPQSRIWPWVTFILFALVIGLLGYSIIKKQTPIATLKQVFNTTKDPGDLSTYSKGELLSIATDSRDRITELKEELAACRLDDGLQKATIHTSSETLNMRADATLESDILLKIPNGSRVSILYYDDEDLFLEGAMGRWCRIRYTDQEGWVWGNYLQTEDKN